MNKFALALLATLALVACGDDEKTVTVTAPTTTQAPTTPTPPPASDTSDSGFTEEDVEVGYKDFVNENATASGNDDRVHTMSCIFQTGNEFICTAEWDSGINLSASVTVAEDGSFIARDVQEAGTNGGSSDSGSSDPGVQS